MRSITYILTGQPRNRTDCIDYARQHQAKKILIELMSNEVVSDQFIAKNLYASYIWVFDDRVVTYEEAYGRILQHEPHHRQRLSIDNANRRLVKALENLRERTHGAMGTGMSIENDEARFGCDLAYGDHGQPPEDQ